MHARFSGSDGRFPARRRHGLPTRPGLLHRTILRHASPRSIPPAHGLGYPRRQHKQQQQQPLGPLLPAGLVRFPRVSRYDHAARSGPWSETMAALIASMLAKVERVNRLSGKDSENSCSMSIIRLTEAKEVSPTANKSSLSRNWPIGQVSSQTSSRRARICSFLFDIRVHFKTICGLIADHSRPKEENRSWPAHSAASCAWAPEPSAIATQG